MMRKLCMLLLCLLWAAPAVALIDNFDTPHDFVADGVSGTDWQAVVYSGGVAGSLQILSSSGKLRMQSQGTTAGGWDGVWDINGDGTADLCPMLLTEVTGDFVLITRFAGINNLQVYHQAAGLIARNPDTSAGENMVQSAFFSVWTGHITWNVVNGARTGEAGATGLNVNQYSFMKLERVGDMFYPSVSQDGITWLPMMAGWSRPDMPETLQVGLFHAMFEQNLGWTEFDFFYGGKQAASISPVEPVVKEDGQTSQTLTIKLTGPAPTSDVYVDVIPYALPYNLDPEANDPNDICLVGPEGPQEPGRPLRIHFPVGTTEQTCLVQAVDDELIEGIEQIGLKLLTYSEDPAYDQQLGQWLLVTVIDDEQGYLDIDTGPGLVVDEHQTMTATFTVSLPYPPTADVTIGLTTPDGQTTVAPTSLVFTPENHLEPQSVTVNAVNDDLVEDDPHTGRIAFTVSSADPFYNGITVPRLTVVIYENNCGAWGYSRFDANQDCVVDLLDIATMASQWLQCTYPHALDCVDVR